MPPPALYGPSASAKISHSQHTRVLGVHTMSAMQSEACGRGRGCIDSATRHRHKLKGQVCGERQNSSNEVLANELLATWT